MLETRETRFAGATFRGPVSFRGATFSGRVDFSDVAWPDRAEYYASAFRDARFLDAADFCTDSFHIVAAFHEAHFARPPLLQLVEGRHQDFAFRKMLRESEAAAHRTSTAGARDVRKAKEDHFGALEGGARVLKQAMETRRSRQWEQRFYRYELIARRHRPSISTWERSLSVLYGAMSNYGDSSLRPLLILLGATIAFGALYSAWAAAFDPAKTWHLLEDGMIYSGRNVFRPFEVWSSRPASTDKAFDSLLLAASTPVPLLARICSSAQSFFSLILTFLIALSLKRKFQLG